jgi:3D (Asp-Asp-Asp) domain-containing protein
MPRVGPSVPLWFQRVCAALTLLGLVGAVRVLDRAAADHPRGPTQQAELTSLEAEAWNDWVSGLNLRLNPFALDRGAPDRASDEIAPGSGSSSCPAEAVEAPAPVHRSPEATPGSAAVSATGQAAEGTRFQRILVTAYCSGISPVSRKPNRTARNTCAAPGTIALSRDLLRTFTKGAPFDFGDKVLIPGVGVFEVSDTMHPRWREKADIWFAKADQARSWGCRAVFVTRVGENAPTIAFSMN